MVIAVLFEQLLPSHRGLKRNHKRMLATSVWEQEEEQQQLQEEERLRHRYPRRWDWHQQKIHNNTIDNSLLDLNQRKEQYQPPRSKVNTGTAPFAAATRPKRKRCKASKCLSSLASDFDVITDWLFYMHCLAENKEQLQQIPEWVMGMVLASCILGTLMWLVLATDGAIATPLLRLLGYDKLSLGHVLFVCVMVEDLPQVILTFLIDEYYFTEEESTAFTNYALINVVTSLYDTLIKMAEAFDERGDVVETGHWCKDTILAHPNKTVTCVLPIPFEDIYDDFRVVPNDDDNYDNNDKGSKDMLVHEEEGGHPREAASAANLARNRKRRIRRRSLLEEATRIVADTKLPPIRFFSASKDGTVKLWDTLVNPPGRQRDVCSRTFSAANSERNKKKKGKHKDNTTTVAAVSCVVVLEKLPPSIEEQLLAGAPPDYCSQQRRSCNDIGSGIGGGCYFLTGSYDGSIQLWNTTIEDCLRLYPTSSLVVDAERVEITSIAHITDIHNNNNNNNNNNNDHMNMSMNCAGRQLQQRWSALSLSTYSLFPCSTATTDYFVTGHKSGKARLWNLWPGSCLKVFHPEEERPPSLTNNFATAIITGGKRTSQYHKLHSVCSMGNSQHFVTASSDGIIRLWNIGMQVPNIDTIYGSSSSSSSNENPNTTTTTAENVHTTDTDTPVTITTVCEPDREFIGHTRAVLSVKCLSSGKVLVSGSEDKTARIWSASTGACLRILVGHAGAVTSVAVVDSWTILTGSRDRTLKMWDALSASCVRTYEGEHKRAVTSVSICNSNDSNSNNNNNNNNSRSRQNGAFCSASEDGTVKLWVFSAISKDSSMLASTRMCTAGVREDDEDEDDHDGTLRDLLGLEDGSLSCMGCRADDDDDDDDDAISNT